MEQPDTTDTALIHFPLRWTGEVACGRIWQTDRTSIPLTDINCPACLSWLNAQLTVERITKGVVMFSIWITMIVLFLSTNSHAITWTKYRVEVYVHNTAGWVRVYNTGSTVIAQGNNLDTYHGTAYTRSRWGVADCSGQDSAAINFFTDDITWRHGTP